MKKKKKQTENFAITDLIGYCHAVRAGVSEECQEDFGDLNQFITIPQIINIVKKSAVAINEDGIVIINHEIHEYIWEEVAQRMMNCAISKLCAADTLECAWDDEIGEFVFWKKDHAENKQEKK